MRHFRPFIGPSSLFLLVTGALALLALGGSPEAWSGWRPATCLPGACFCEAIRPEFVRQPIDTWSNLAFVLVGLLILADVLRPSSTRSNLLAQSRTYGVVYALAAVLIGLGSWFYHASLTFVGQWFDVMGMYLLGTFMVLYSAARLGSYPRRGIGMPCLRMDGGRFAAWYVALNFALAISLIVVPELRRYLFGLLLVITIALDVAWRRRNSIVDQPRYFIAALAIYVLAQIIWTLDLNHIVCDPYSLWQGHAVWHILTATSASLLYLYYRSENDPRIN